MPRIHEHVLIADFALLEHVENLAGIREVRFGDDLQVEKASLYETVYYGGNDFGPLNDDNYDICIMEYGGIYYLVDVASKTIRVATNAEVVQARFNNMFESIYSTNWEGTAMMIGKTWDDKYYRVDYDTITAEEISAPEYYFIFYVAAPGVDTVYCLAIYDSSLYGISGSV